jgi:hypothetical protein
MKKTNPYSRLKRKKRLTKKEKEERESYLAIQRLNEACIEVSSALTDFTKAFDELKKGIQRGYYF